MKRNVFLVVMILIVGVIATQFVFAQEFKQDTLAGVALPLDEFFNIRRGWQFGKVFVVGGEVQKLWDDKTMAMLWLRPNPWHTGFGVGLGYKEYPVKQTESADNLLLAVSLQANTEFVGCKLWFDDRIYLRALGKFAPSDKLETNNFQVGLGKNLSPFNFEAIYGFKNWRPYDGNDLGITSQRRLRLGVPLEVGASAMEIGCQTMSQRFSSETEAWRLRSWLGVYWTWQVGVLDFDLSYNFGKFEQARIWRVSKVDNHYLALKIILGQEVKELKRR